MSFSTQFTVWMWFCVMNQLLFSQQHFVWTTRKKKKVVHFLGWRKNFVECRMQMYLFQWGNPAGELQQSWLRETDFGPPCVLEEKGIYCTNFCCCLDFLKESSGFFVAHLLRRFFHSVSTGLSAFNQKNHHWQNYRWLFQFAKAIRDFIRSQTLAATFVFMVPNKSTVCTSELMSWVVLSRSGKFSFSLTFVKF